MAVKSATSYIWMPKTQSYSPIAQTAFYKDTIEIVDSLPAEGSEDVIYVVPLSAANQLPPYTADDAGKFLQVQDATSLAWAEAATGEYLPLTGGTINGMLGIHNDSDSALELYYNNDSNYAFSMIASNNNNEMHHMLSFNYSGAFDNQQTYYSFPQDGGIVLTDVYLRNHTSSLFDNIDTFIEAIESSSISSENGSITNLESTSISATNADATHLTANFIHIEDEIYWTDDQSILAPTFTGYKDGLSVSFGSRTGGTFAPGLYVFLDENLSVDDILKLSIGVTISTNYGSYFFEANVTPGYNGYANVTLSDINNTTFNLFSIQTQVVADHDHGMVLYCRNLANFSQGSAGWQDCSMTLNRILYAYTYTN